ncbi:MAG TPA: PadR family transcriptional regulator [Candidatus Saccharimonadales bacterium]
MKITLSEHLILGILAEQIRHGYDIEKIISERGMRKWTDIGFSSIYYLLAKLETKGLVSSTYSHGKEKKQFSITDKGISILKDKTKELITERKPANTHLMTGLATSDFIEAKNLKKTLQQRKLRLVSDLEELQNTQLVAQNLPQPARRLFSLSEVLIQAELDWVNAELEKVGS